MVQQNSEITEICRKAIAEAFECFHSELNRIAIEKFETAQKIAEFIAKTSERQEKLLESLESLTKAFNELAELLKNKREITYAR